MQWQEKNIIPFQKAGIMETPPDIQPEFPLSIGIFFISSNALPRLDLSPLMLFTIFSPVIPDTFSSVSF
jgi:hypothetical protein